MAADGANTIEFKVGAVEIRCSGDGDWLSRQAGEILRSLNTLGATGLLAPPRAESPGELLARSKAATAGEKAGVIAYWLQEFGGRSRWRSGEIVKELEKLGEPAPANITDALNHKLRRGYFSTTDRMWELTSAGRSWVLYDLLGEPEDPEPGS